MNEAELTASERPKSKRPPKKSSPAKSSKLQPNPDFTLEDINPASELYSQDIGPSFFSGQVSCYYFGKQG